MSPTLCVRLPARRSLGQSCQLFEGTRLPIKFEGAHAVISSDGVHYRQLHLISKTLDEVFRVGSKNGDANKYHVMVRLTLALTSNRKRITSFGDIRRGGLRGKGLTGIML